MHFEGSVVYFSFRSLEYDPRFYGLFFHDDTQLPTDVSMWDHLDEGSQGYQDSLVMHMVYKPVQVSLQEEEERYVFSSEKLEVLGLKCD